MAGLGGNYCLISGAFVTLPLSHPIDVDRGRALARLNDETRSSAGRCQTSCSEPLYHSNTERPICQHPKCGRDRAQWTAQVHRQAARPIKKCIVLTALRNRTATTSVLRGELRAASNVNVSSLTIRNRLHESNIRSTRPSSRPSLVQAHCAAGLHVICHGQGNSGQAALH